MIARTNGLLAGFVSVILGIGAHGFAGGALPETGQLMILAVIGFGVGALRSARSKDSWTSIAAVLVGGQVAAHATLSLIGTTAGHHHDVGSLAMLGWHLIAVPAAVVVLCSTAWLLTVLTTTIGIVVEPGCGVSELAPKTLAGAAVSALHHLTPRLSVGMRAPPLVG